MAELPQNWIECELQRLVDIINGYAFKSSLYVEKGYRIVRITNVQKGFFVDTNPKFYAPTEDLQKYELKGDDILLSLTGNVGRVCIMPQKFLPAYLNQRVGCLRIKIEKCLNYKYLFYQLSTDEFEKICVQNSRGNAQLNLGTEFVKTVNIKLPPLNEQKRIVEKLDKMMRIVDNVNARLDKIPTALKRARQSILNQAITGELTKDWREKNLDIIPASIMIEQFKQLLLESSSKNERDNINNIFSYKENYFSFDIPHTWTFSILEKLCKSFKYGTSTKSESSGLVPVLRMGNIQKGEIDWNDLVYTSDSKEIEKYKLEKNDVLFNRTNSPELVGKTAIYRGERAAIYAGYLIKIENYKILNSEYLNYALNSTFAKEWKLDVKTDGVSQSNINAQKLAKFEVPLPPLEEQAEIVRRVKLAFEKLDKIELRYQKAKEYSDKLTQSILNKAFRGELVPQDPNDKPISLDDIQVQIAEKPSKKRKTLKNNKVQEMAKEIIEILKEYPEGISPEELFKNSKYSQKDFTDDDIIEFYKELSNLLDSKLTEEKDSVNHKILIKKVK